MNVLTSSLVASSTTPLVILNLLLGGACAACVLAVGVAVVLDLRERRRWRSLVPPCWPPPGVDPREAYAEPEPSAAEPHVSSRHGRTT